MTKRKTYNPLPLYIAANPPVNPRWDINAARQVLQHFIDRNNHFHDFHVREMIRYQEMGKVRSANKHGRIAKTFQRIADGFVDTLGQLEGSFRPGDIKAHVRGCK